MLFEKPDLASLKNESDVEQKFLYPLLIGATPEGLGFDPSQIHTKNNIRKFTIGKGAEQKSYFPDYIITVSAVPFLIAEAKAPGIALEEAFREARLYAHELNSQYEPGLNPVAKIFVTNGNEIWAGSVDHTIPSLIMPYSDIGTYSSAHSELTSTYNHAALASDQKRVFSQRKVQRYWKPRKLVGGAALQREEVTSNSFGETISAEFSNIFNPISLEDRKFIAEHGYISSKRRERYVEPIDRVIPASVPLSETKSKILDDTANPVELVKVFRTTRQLEHQVLLIVGSAGAGKTSFIDHLREVALPKDVRSKTLWFHLNMNQAPISNAEIYNWLRDEIIASCRKSNPNSMFADNRFNVLVDLKRADSKIGKFERQLIAEPWASAYRRYLPGETYIGKVKNVTNFGIFVELEPAWTG